MHLQMHLSILSHERKSYQPLNFIHGNGSNALDVESKMVNTDLVLKYHNNGTAKTVISLYTLTDVVFNLRLLKVGNIILKSYNQIARNKNERKFIPCSTLNNHQSAITGRINTFFISHNSFDVRRLYSMFVLNTHGMTPNKEKHVLHGSRIQHDATTLTSYN